MRSTLLLGLLVSPAFAVDYARDVKPLLQERCYACHGALKQQGKLRVDSGEFLRKKAVLPGKSAASSLIERVSEPDEHSRMPPEGLPLTPEQIAKLKAWIDEGAIVPADDKAEADPREHWAFRLPIRPAIPKSDWGTNAIDAFLATEWSKHGLKPQALADQRLLLRSVYLDLVGLPPTEAEIDAFLKDASTDAYAKVVDRLLASPQYGERWGRHLMDIYRYADWWGLGAEVRHSQKNMWHWRDWLIESLNANKGYDQMVKEMLAADELYPTDSGKLRATGYLARSYFYFNRTTWLDETVEHTAKAFLGLTFNCSKCHDHKYDPISHADYYKLRAFFEPYQIRTDMVAGNFDIEKTGIPRAFDANLDAPTYRHERGDESKPIKSVKIEPGLPGVFAAELKIAAVPLPFLAHAPQFRPFVESNFRESAKANATIAKASVDGAQDRYTKVKLAAGEGAGLEPYRLDLARAKAALAMYEAELDMIATRFTAERWPGWKTLAMLAAQGEKTHALRKAEFELAGAEYDNKPSDLVVAKKLDAAKKAIDAARKALEKPGETYTAPRGSLKTKESNVEADASRFKPFPTTSTGRRSALANWIADARNPLTARVIVNHVWARHFGRPLVNTLFDFGRKGTAPTHPELLDYLATELMEHQWSLKHLHRLMVMSSAYRLSSSPTHESAKSDEANRYYWRRHSVRMESQVVRDSLLQLAGQLDLTSGGPSLDVNAASKRRSVYFTHSHNDHQKFLMQFDDAAVLECYRRTESIVPQQALTLANSQFALSMADAIASRLEGTDEEYVRRAFALMLGTTPTAEEMKTCLDAMAEWGTLLQASKHANPAAKARANLIGALVNHNDFVTVR